MDRFCTNEADYHQRVIRLLATFPDLLKARPGLKTHLLPPLMGGAITKLNDWVASKLHEPSFQKFIKQYHFEIQSVQLALQGGDLALAIKLSSQMSIAEADKTFSDLIPLSGSW